MVVAQVEEPTSRRLGGPITDRFHTQDPLGFGAGDSNLYRYVMNDPTNLTDPTGMAGWSFSGAVGSFFQGAAEEFNAVAPNLVPSTIVTKAVVSIAFGKTDVKGAATDALASTPGGQAAQLVVVVSGDIKQGNYGAALQKGADVAIPSLPAVRAITNGDVNGVAKEAGKFSVRVPAALATEKIIANVPPQPAKFTVKESVSTTVTPPPLEGVPQPPPALKETVKATVKATVQVTRIEPPPPPPPGFVRLTPDQIKALKISIKPEWNQWKVENQTVIDVPQNAIPVGTTQPAQSTVTTSKPQVHPAFETGVPLTEGQWEFPTNATEQAVLAEAKAVAGQKTPNNQMIVPKEKIYGDPYAKYGVFEKWTYVVTKNGQRYEIHYMKNVETGETGHFKFVIPGE